MDSKEIWISNFINCMRYYQKINGITKQCLTNVQFLYGILIDNFNYDKKRFEVKTVIVFSASTGIVCIHLVLQFDDFIIDPSYEIFSITDREYYSSIGDLFYNKKISLSKEYIKLFLSFISLANRMNKGEYLVANKLFYNKQADYVEKNIYKYKM